MQCQARLQVSGLVLVDDVGLGQLVEHLLNLGVEGYGLVLVSHGAQLANGVAHGLGIVLVVQGPGFCLADSLLR